jgi:polyisoprenyl-phosphate glycosyltransferase
MTDPTLHSSFVSVILPVSNGAGYLGEVVSEVVATLHHRFADYEVVIVDDGSTDETPAIISALLKMHAGLRAFSLPRRNGNRIAIAVGLDVVIGDFVVVLDPRTDPPAVIPDIVERAKAGADVLYGVDRERPRFTGLAATLANVFHFYVERYIGLEFPRQATHLWCLSRRAVNALARMGDQASHFRVFGSITGYRSETFEYRRRALAPATESSLLEAVSEGVELITVNSPHPLRVVTLMGVILASVNLLYMCYIVVIYLLKDDVMEGWTTLSMQTSVLFMAVFLILLALSEYTGRILQKIQGRPLYFVRDEQVSAVMIPRDRVNLVSEAVEEKPMSGEAA